MIPRLIFISTAIPLFLGCSPNIQSYLWLVGTWEMQNPDGSQRIETWSAKSNTSLDGKGYKVTGSDTILLESIELRYADGYIWYVPTVPDQNNAQEVPFKLVSGIDHKYIFENPEHDFPQRIVYHFKPVHSESSHGSSVGDTLFARVESMDGKGISFLFVRK